MTSIKIEITHYPHLNFYKNIINILMEKKIDVQVVLRPRGNLVSIFQKECSNVPYIIFGRHRKGVYGKMFDMIERDIKLLKYLSKNEFNLVTGGGINLTHVAYLLKKPSIMFTDDVEYKSTYYLYKPFATKIVVPSSIETNGEKFLKYNGFKELAYLHPNTFKPNNEALKPYDIKPNEYVFIREVSNASLNYRKLRMGKIHNTLSYLREKGLKILLSIEDKTLINLFENKCIILKEPLQDVHSLLSYALFTISSGDSMARESCLVGTPSIYTGGREMAINKELIRKSCMFKVDDVELINNTIDYIMNNDIKKEVQTKIDLAIKNEWVDTTEVIYDVLMGTVCEDDSLIEKYKSNLLGE